LIICITGSGYVSKKAAEDLLFDFIVEGHESQRVIFIFPSYIMNDGLKNVRDAVVDIESSVYHKDKDDVMWEVERAKKSELPDTFLTGTWDGNGRDGPRILMVLDAETEAEFVTRCIDARVEVYDLSKGLYPVTSAGKEDSDSQMPLDGSRTNAEGLTGTVWYDGMGEKKSPLASLSEPYRGIWDDISRVEGLSDTQLQEIERIIVTQIKIHEKNFHPVYAPDQLLGAKFDTPDMTGKLIESEEAEQIQPDKVAYYKSKIGKFRKAGNSKARPGEEIVMLTQEEINKL
jgi:hypothetical protein